MVGYETNIGEENCFSAEVNEFSSLLD